MKLTLKRKSLVKLRKNLIKFKFEDKYIEGITDLLIDYPTMEGLIENQTPNEIRNQLDKFTVRESTSTGYGAFGEPESRIDIYIKLKDKDIKKSWDWGDFAIIDNDGSVIDVIKYWRKDVKFNDLTQQVLVKMRQELENKLKEEIADIKG